MWEQCSGAGAPLPLCGLLRLKSRQSRQQVPTNPIFDYFYAITVYIINFPFSIRFLLLIVYKNTKDSPFGARNQTQNLTHARQVLPLCHTPDGKTCALMRYSVPLWMIIDCKWSLSFLNTTTAYFSLSNLTAHFLLLWSRTSISCSE